MIYQENWLSSTSTAQTTIKTAKVLQDGLWRPYKAPELSGIEAWINSHPLQLADLKGKVVLIDFWAYSCINCIRTFPYIKAWYSQYKDKGLVIIGIHSPEFDFEKKQENVERAAKNNELRYPIALDNQFVNWHNFNNHYWPAHYLINKQGMIVYQHFGEGNYGITENNIRFLLGLDEPLLHQKLSGDNASAKETPETYLGYARVNNQLSPSPLIQDKTAHYQFPSVIATNAWALEGDWQVKSEKIISQNDKASLKINFQARKVFIVMGSKTGKPIQVKVLLNGKPLITDQGKEVNNSQIQVQQHSIYEVVVFKDFSSGILQLSPNNTGLEIYTFTFGS